MTLIETPEPKQTNGRDAAPRALVSWDSWLRELGRTSTTGWRWRRNGWITPLNICGRLYLTGEEIAKFTQRAAGGEFSRHHPTPTRSTKD